MGALWRREPNLRTTQVILPSDPRWEYSLERDGSAGATLVLLWSDSPPFRVAATSWLQRWSELAAAGAAGRTGSGPRSLVNDGATKGGG